MSKLSSAAHAASGKDAKLELDYSERSGFLTGKAARLADWAHRREEARYKRLFRNLKRNALRKDPEVRDRLNARARERAARPEAKARKAIRTRKPAYRKMQYAANQKYRNKPEIRERLREYNREYERKHRAKRREQKRRSDAKPEVKARNAARNAAYRARPEVKARIKEQSRARRAALRGGGADG